MSSLDFTEADIAKFWGFVRRAPTRNDCWGWDGRIRKPGHREGGYGFLNVGSRATGNKRVMSAHRIACVLAHGLPPEGKPHALHSCDNRPCCNDLHLRWGTHQENMDDMMKRQRRFDTSGNRNPNAKLTAKDALAIFLSPGSQASIAQRFQTSKANVQRIKSKVIWQSIHIIP